MRLIIYMTLLSIVFFGCVAPMEDMEVSISPADKAKMQKLWVTKTYPYEEKEMWQMAFSVCEEREYVAWLYDKPNGYIETRWKTQKHSDSPDFANKIKRYGSPLSSPDVKWDGMRYRLLILIVQIDPTETRFQIRAEIQARCSSGSGIWRWWLSNGTLESMFLTHLETKLDYDPQISR